MENYWRAIISLALRGQEGNFLGSPIVPALLMIAPSRMKRSLALSLVAASPHYFVHQYDKTMYPPPITRRDVLKREQARMKSVAGAVFSNLLRARVVRKRVLDFGCGPGYIANEVAEVATLVTGVDVSRGVIACAQSLHARENIRYLVIDGKSLRCLPTASFDVVYSVAVLMHISDELIPGILKEISRVVGPGGEVVLHVPLANIPSDNFDAFDTVRRQICLRYIVRSESGMRRMMEEAGFTAIDIRPVSELSPAQIDADIRNHHLVTARSG